MLLSAASTPLETSSSRTGTRQWRSHGARGAASPGAHAKKFGATTIRFVLKMFLTKPLCVELENLVYTFFQQISYRFADFRQLVSKLLFWILSSFMMMTMSTVVILLLYNLPKYNKNDLCCTDIASEYRTLKLVYKEVFPVYHDV